MYNNEFNWIYRIMSEQEGIYRSVNNFQWLTTDIDFLPSPSNYFLFDFLLYVLMSPM